MYSEFKISRVKSSTSAQECVSEIEIRHGLDFILKHFAAMDFPRKLSTKTTEGRQILVDDKPQALARFKQANWLDCRISAYTQLDDEPIIDFDINCQNQLDNVLTRIFKTIGGNPTVLFTGSGYHIYQPILSVSLEKYSNFSNYEEPSKQFLKFAEKYLSNRLSDANHNPSFKSCMVRLPGSINSKNGELVKIIRKWDGKRPDIVLLLGSFCAWLASKNLAERQNCNKNYYRNSSAQANNKIQWIEALLNTAVDDYRKTIVNLILAPYFVNIRGLANKNAYEIIKEWLELCAAKRKLDFNVDSLIGNALHNAVKTGYKPMRLHTLKIRNHEIYKELA